MSSSTAFPLGVYVGSPNGSSASANASFESNFNSFVTGMSGARPLFMDAFTDFTQDPSQWASNAGWTAWSWAQTGSLYVGPGSGITPVIGLPLASNAGGWSAVDTFFKAIIAGTYDADYKGVVDAWAAQGYKTMQMRIAYEFDGNFMPWGPGNSSQPTVDADFVAAWQHVASLVHAEGTALGVTVQTVWNPADINWTSPSPTKLYPGDQYVDIISTDVYSPVYPLDLTNWSTGGKTQMANVTAWAAIAANRAHYWEYTDATQYAPTGSSQGWSMLDTINFAAAHGKPLSISETGAGGNGTTLGPVDDPAFPQWLAGALAQAQAAGVKIQNVDIWATDQSDGDWGFLNGEKPGEAAAWNKYFGAGSGSGSSSAINLAALGTVQEASPGAGVTVTETVYATGLSTIYEEVVTAAGSVEGSGYVAVALTNGSGSFSVHLATTGDYVQAVDNPTSASVTADSTPVTITDPVGTVAVAPPTTLVLGQDNFIGTVTGGSPNVVKFAWHASLTGETASSADMVTATKQANGTYAATVTIDHLGQIGYFYVAVDGTVTNEWSAVPVAAAPTITLGALGTVQEAAPGAGVTVTETVSATGLSTIYEEILTAAGSVEGGGYVAVALTNGPGSFSVNLATTGDYVQAVDNPTSPSVTADSTPVTITAPPIPTIVSSGAFSSGLTLGSGAIELVLPGGSALATTVQSGATLVVISGGTASGTTTQTGGRVVSTGIVIDSAPSSVALDGTATSGLIAGSGTSVFVLSGGATTATFVAGGGMEVVFSGGTASVTTIGSGGLQKISAGGAATATVVSNGGVERVLAGGTASSASIGAGGNQLVSAGGSALGTAISGTGAIERTYSGGTLVGASIAAGGFAFVSAGGVTSGTIVGSGGGDNVSSGGVASGTTVLAGGFERIYGGGLASATTLASGATQYASSGGATMATSVGAGGVERVCSGGTASSAIVASGGRIVVSQGGLTTGTVVGVGGVETVLAGGIDVGAVVSSGGTEFIYSAATISGGTLISGAKLIVSAGGVAAGLTLSGGMVNLSGAVAAGQAITFAGPGADLAVYNLPGFAGVIGGFATRDTIDLGGFAYNSAVTRSFVEASGGASGTLTLSGSSQASLTLLGSYATSNFGLSADTAGGTFVKFS